MSWSYSEDLRVKVINALQRKVPILKISKVFGIARNTVYNWKNLFIETGSITPRKTETEKRFLIKDLDKFKKFLEDNPDKTQKEMAEEWGGVSPRTIGATIKRVGYTYKKKLLATNKETQKKELRISKKLKIMNQTI